MRVLFLIHRLPRVRHFDSVIEMLAARGHKVTLAASALKRSETRRSDSLERLEHLPSIVRCPNRREDDWNELAPQLRRARDCLRFLEERFARADALRERGRAASPTFLIELLRRRSWLRQHSWRLSGALALAEQAIPSAPRFDRFIVELRPRVILVTPLVLFESYQTDFVKSAHRLGVPIAFLPFSWDNLTTRGLIHVTPDRVFAWSDIQKREAVSMHGVPPERVVVTGAPRFDDFFALEPSTTRRQFCNRAGLDPARPILLYLGSSPLVAPSEPEFVKRWIQEVRKSDCPELSAASILVRPHPTRQSTWPELTPSRDGVAIWQPQITKIGGQDLFDTLHHSAVVVGLNTSALIEAGIAGKSTLTLDLPAPNPSPNGTLHGEYLLEANGGLLCRATSWGEHRQQLARALRDPEAGRPRALEFVRRFVRPHGLDCPATPIMVDEIERLANLEKRPRASGRIWGLPIRQALLRFGRSYPFQPLPDDKQLP